MISLKMDLDSITNLFDQAIENAGPGVAADLSRALHPEIKPEEYYLCTSPHGINYKEINDFRSFRNSLLALKLGSQYLTVKV